MPSNPPVPATPLDIEACVRLLTHFAAQEEARAEFMDEQARKILRMNTAYTVDSERENAAEYREQAATLRALITFLRSALPGMGKDSERLRQIREQCRVIYYGTTDMYPIEHAPGANKDSWEWMMLHLDADAARAALPSSRETTDG